VSAPVCCRLVTTGLTCTMRCLPPTLTGTTGGQPYWLNWPTCCPTSSACKRWTGLKTWRRSWSNWGERGNLHATAAAHSNRSSPKQQQQPTASGAAHSNSSSSQQQQQPSSSHHLGNGSSRMKLQPGSKVVCLTQSGRLSDRQQQTISYAALIALRCDVMSHNGVTYM